MASFFGWSKSPAEIVRLATQSMTGTDEEARKELVKRVGEMKTYVCGESQTGKAPKEDKCAAIAQAMIENDIIELMARCFQDLDFEVRKQLTAVVSRCTTQDYAGFCSSYLLGRTAELAALLAYYEHAEAALLAGAIVRDAVRSSAALHMGILAAEPHHEKYMPLNAHVVALLHTHVNAAAYEVAGDAQATVKVLTTSNPAAMRDFLSAHHSVFFTAYDELLLSKQYTTRLEGLQLLSELLLDTANFSLMVEYATSTAHMRTVMLLLRDKHSSVQFEAFHLFKLFVANPGKPPSIAAILAMNRDRLVAFMRGLCNDRDDADFLREKALIIEKLMSTEQDPAGLAPAGAAGGSAAPALAAGVEAGAAAAAEGGAAAAPAPAGAPTAPSEAAAPAAAEPAPVPAPAAAEPA